MLEYLEGLSGLDVSTSNYGPTTRAEYLREEFAEYNFNLLNIECADETWDVIICHRVLEHIPDDRRGMRELYRILKPGGLLLFSVPMDMGLESTIEYDRPQGLENDHYYRYGRDFPDRIPKELNAQPLLFSEVFTPQDFRQFGLLEDVLFVVEK